MNDSTIKYYNLNSVGFFNFRPLFSVKQQQEKRSQQSARNVESRPDTSRVILGTEETNELLSSQTTSHIEYTLELFRSSSEQLSANSYYRSEDSGIHVSLAYTFARTIQTEGSTLTKQFQLTVDIEAHNTTQSSATLFNHKEDLLHFVRRVVDNIYDASQNEHKLLVGVAFDLDDLEEIAGIERGKLLELLNDFVCMVAMLARLRQINKGIDSLDPVVIHPEREKSSGIAVFQSSQQTMNVQFSFREITASVSTVSSGKTSSSSATTTG
jgi:hypothetical protein